MTLIAALAAHPRNYNRHSAGQVADLARSLTRFGQRKPVVTWRGVILAGHGLVEAARSLGWTEIWTAEAPEEWTEAEALAFVAADNELARAADPDLDALAALVAEVGDVDAELARLAAGGEEALKRLLASIQQPAGEDPGAQVDKAEELRVKWGVETGQLWALGEHRLICGDCTDAAVVARVMGGERADMVFTDPPYGHSNNDGDLIHNWEAALGRPKTASSAARPIANDKPEDAARLYSAFLKTANELLKPGCCCCCCCGGGGPDPQFARWTMEMDEVIGFKMAVVWDKGGLGMGWHYRRNYEFVLVAEKPGAACHWFGGNSVANVVRDIGKIIPSSEQHPTEKPVELPELFIKLHSQPGEIVWEPFSGSGSTLIACEQLGRWCRAVEISPGYVAVALERWSVMTGGRPAILE